MRGIRRGTSLELNRGREMRIQNEREFNRYSIALFDFTKAQDFLSEARKHPSNSLPFQALLFAAIVCYYRPFSLNEKLDTSPATSNLNISEFGSLLDSEKGIHEECKKLRNKALAHSEYSFNPTGIDPQSKVIVSKPFWLTIDSIDIDGLSKLVDKFITICHHMRADYKLHGLS
jgi:hypothetical protein